jgi:hypothetical protein
MEYVGLDPRRSVEAGTESKETWNSQLLPNEVWQLVFSQCNNTPQERLVNIPSTCRLFLHISIPLLKENQQVKRLLRTLVKDLLCRPLGCSSQFKGAPVVFLCEQQQVQMQSICTVTYAEVVEKANADGFLEGVAALRQFRFNGEPLSLQPLFDQVMTDVHWLNYFPFQSHQALPTEVVLEARDLAESILKFTDEELATILKAIVEWAVHPTWISQILPTWISIQDYKALQDICELFLTKVMKQTEQSNWNELMEVIKTAMAKDTGNTLENSIKEWCAHVWAALKKNVGAKTLGSLLFCWHGRLKLIIASMLAKSTALEAYQQLCTLQKQLLHTPRKREKLEPQFNEQLLVLAKELRAALTAASHRLTCEILPNAGFIVVDHGCYANPKLPRIEVIASETLSPPWRMLAQQLAHNLSKGKVANSWKNDLGVLELCIR